MYIFINSLILLRFYQSIYLSMFSLINLSFYLFKYLFCRVVNSPDLGDYIVADKNLKVGFHYIFFKLTPIRSWGGAKVPPPL